MVYLWSVWHVQAAAFNLDTQNVLKKSGDPGSLFGFSVAFHQQLNPTRRNLWVKILIIWVLWVNWIELWSYHLRLFPLRLLVGAPRAKHPNEVNVTGVTYQCELTTTSERCQPIEFDHEGSFCLFYLKWCDLFDENTGYDSYIWDKHSGEEVLTLKSFFCLFICTDRRNTAVT